MCETVLVKLFESGSIVFCVEKTVADGSEECMAAHRQIQALKKAGKRILNLNSLDVEILQKVEKFVSQMVNCYPKEDSRAFNLLEIQGLIGQKQKKSTI